MIRAKRYIKILYIILFHILAIAAVFGETVSSESVFDLSQQDFSNKPIALNGQWDFYWNEFVSPGQFMQYKRESINIPDSWHQNKDYPIFGFGTYHTVIYLPDNLENTGLYIPFSLNHYRIFVNDHLVAESGEVSRERQADRGTVNPPIIVSLPNKNRLEIIIHVSNYDDFIGGLSIAPEIGILKNQILKKTRIEIMEAILFGIYLITGMLYVSFFINRRSDKSSIYFGLFCLVLSFRTILYGEYLILLLFPGLSMELISTLGHMTYYIAYPVFLRFIAVTYPFRLSRWLEYPSYIISTFYVLIALTTPHHFYIFLLVYYQILSIIGCLIIVAVLIIWSIRKDVFARITLLGFVLLFGTAVNDILYAQNILHTFYMIPLGFGLFIMTQSGLMNWRIAIAFSQAETLSKELTVTNHSFKRFVPEEFLKFLKKEKISDISLGDNTQMDMSIMFLDIRNFTSMSEKMTPREIFHFLNSFFDRVCPVIRTNGGFIDKYLGDGIMALFPGKPYYAVKTAIEMLEMLAIYNNHRKIFNYNPIRIGIGVHTGSLMLGTLGEEERMDSTVISDSVNLCARLESITKEYHFNIAISEDTYNAIEDKNLLQVRNMGNIPLKGKKTRITIYELFNNDEPELKKKKIKYREEFEQAVKLLDKKAYTEARSMFEEIKDKFPEDKPAQVFLKKIRKI